MINLDSPFPKVSKNIRKVVSFKIFSKAILFALAIFGLVFILLLIALIGLLGKESQMAEPMPEKAILTINFDDEFPERSGDEWLYGFSEAPSMTFYELIKSINVAASDDRIKALAGDINVSSLGLAQIEELRDTIKYFRSKGKKAYIYSTGMGVFGGGTSEYYLASAFDEIWMQPNTELGITGINIEVPFLRDTLSKVGVTPEFYARHEYKNAMSSLMENQLSPQYKSEMIKLGKNIFMQFAENAAKDRNISMQEMLKLVDSAPLLAEDALKYKLIDKVAFRNDFDFKVTAKSQSAKFYPIYAYNLEIKNNRGRVPVVALLVLDGEIVDGDARQDMWQQGIISSRQTVKQLKEIAKLPNLKGLVVRVNSPGGSYTASAEIWNEINLLKKKKNIPVVVSMGDYAASGGYFVSLAGDYILAEPLTITGSIGVLGGKMVLENLWKKLNVHWAELQFGKNSGILSANRKFSPSERAAFNRSLDNVYRDFTSQVEKARHIPSKELDKLARGRVWQGSDAVKHHLVDALGGLNSAFAKVRELAKLEKGQKYRIVEFPRPKTLAEKINELISGNPQVSATKILQSSGLPWQKLQLLHRLQYDAVLLPFEIVM